MLDAISIARTARHDATLKVQENYKKVQVDNEGETDVNEAVAKPCIYPRSAEKV